MYNGGNATEAYLEAYDSSSRQSAHVNGAKVANMPIVIDRIIELRQLYNNAIQIDPKQYLTTQLLNICDTSVFDLIDDTGQ